MSPRRSAPLTLEYVLLGLLKCHPMHGYELYKALNQPIGVGVILAVKQARLYALLDKLAAAGMLEPHLISGENRPDRVEYHLTEAGNQMLLSWVATPVEHAREMRQEFLGKLYFAQQIDGKIAAKLIADQEEIVKIWLKGHQQTMNALSPEQDYERSVLTFRILQEEALQTWLNSLSNGRSKRA